MIVNGTEVKSGDKFIIEVGEILRNGIGKEVCQIKGFNTLFFDKPGLERLKKVDQTKREKDRNLFVGEEVVVKNRKAIDGNEIRFVITRIDGNDVHGINYNGTIHCFPQKDLKTTGYSYGDISRFLEFLKSNHEKTIQ